LGKRFWESDVSLTPRQQAFLEQLLDVYHVHRRQPIHYSEVARALRVANSTAYDMMRLLESKGYVSSEYRLADRHAGPGRSQVVFKPTMKALRTWRGLLSEDVRSNEWQAVKDTVLERIASDGLPQDEGLLAELLAAIPESEDPLSYCGRVVAASLLSMRRHVASRVEQLGILREIAGGQRSALEILDLLPGFALGFASALRESSMRLSRLTEYGKRYQAYLRRMDEETRMRLLRFSHEIMVALRFPLKTG
jgi:DNA-binding MarR family transcriptional regulator